MLKQEPKQSEGIAIPRHAQVAHGRL